MKTSLTKFGLGVCAVAALASGASAQKASGAERGLVGINLYDSGIKVVSLYGSPDEIQAVTIGATGGSSGGPGFGGPGGAGPGFGGPGGGAPAGRGGPGPAGSAADGIGPFDFGNGLLRPAPPSGSGGYPTPPSGGGGGYPGGPPGGYPGAGGAPGGFPGAGGAPSGGGAPTNTGPTEATQYTRWVYNRAGSKYGFIIDNQGRVVQVEAIGLQNNRVKTRKGLGFGATFAQIIKTYGNPDGYEVGGDSILVKYLVNKKVAFRLTRLGAKKPHVVTGIVVAAGKV